MIIGERLLFAPQLFFLCVCFNCLLCVLVFFCFERMLGLEMFCFAIFKKVSDGQSCLCDLWITKPINLWNNSTLTDASHRAVDPLHVRGCGLETLGRWVDQAVESWYFHDCQYQPHVAGRNEKYHGFAMMFFVFFGCGAVGCCQQTWFLAESWVVY